MAGEKPRVDVRWPEGSASRLDAIAAGHGIDRTEAICRLIEKGLDKA